MSAERPTDLEHIHDVLNARRVGWLDRAKQIIIDREKFLPNAWKTVSGLTPEVTLNGVNWGDFVLSRYREIGRAPRILDIGAGDDCTAWTISIADGRLDNTVRRVRQDIPDLYVVGHSAHAPVDDPFAGTCVREFHAGHFIDVLRQLLQLGDQFDAVLSRHALYMSATVLDLLPIIDELLLPGGAAFLDTVSKGQGNDKVLVYPPYDYPWEGLDRAEVFRALLFTETDIGGLTWQHTETGVVGTAWKKGQLDPEKMPVLVDVNYGERNWFKFGYFDWFRLIYALRD